MIAELKASIASGDDSIIKGFDLVVDSGQMSKRRRARHG